jgi:D-apionolactonase
MIQGVKLIGKTEIRPSPQILRSGELTMLYEAGNLRYIRAGGHEIIRMIYFAVRDKDWLTIPPVISGERIRKKRNGFEIGFKANYRFKDIDFEAGISITSMSPNRLTLEMKGLAKSTFMKNRIGFCILHPIMNCAGNKCRITHPDNSSTMGRFPAEISPHQPFKDIRAMHWKIKDALEAHLYFEGDVFETEDQRNWTDASYKTYNTPLDEPYPAEVAEGSQLYQRVEFSLEGNPPGTSGKDEIIIFNVGKQAAGKLPELGVSVSSRPQPLSEQEAGILKNIPFSHIRGELHLFSTRFEKQYAILSGESIKTKLPAELCLFFGDDPQAELSKFLTLYNQYPIPVKRILVYSGSSSVASNTLLSTVIPSIRREFSGIPTGTGTNCNFAQINRSRPDFKNIDFITFAIHPQEHASDERTLIENTATQQYAVQSAANFKMHYPVIVSPVTLQRRFNANNNNYEVPCNDNEMPPGVDSRQMSLFGAAWTVGSLKYLLESEATSITYYESAGERGLFMGEHSSRWPEQFYADKGMFFPLFHIFSILLNKGKYRVHGSLSTDPLVIDGFAVTDNKSGLLFLSNMTSQKKRTKIAGIDEYRILLRMNSGNFDEICRNYQLQGKEKEDQRAVKTGDLLLQPYETIILEYNF